MLKVFLKSLQKGTSGLQNVALITKVLSKESMVVILNSLLKLK